MIYFMYIQRTKKIKNEQATNTKCQMGSKAKRVESL